MHFVGGEISWWYVKHYCNSPAGRQPFTNSAFVVLSAGDSLICYWSMIYEVFIYILSWPSGME